MLISRYQWDAGPTVNSRRDLLRQLYLNRGITDNHQVKQYLRPSWSQVHSPWQLHDMQLAVDRIKLAISRQEQITVYGDYDADGMTSTSLLYGVLLKLGARVNYFVPDRFKDGYGPNLAEYQRLYQQGTQLMVTVDNGVSGKDVIDPMVDAGLDVVITDHHDLPDQLPVKATAIVHPAYPGSNYPFTGLSGVGVAFKLAWALLGRPPYYELDLVAIGEIADVVPVDDENRALITAGLHLMSNLKQESRLGLKTLIEQINLADRELTSTDIGFDIAPRLNSFGRIGQSSDGVRLLTSDNLSEVNQLVSEVELLNTQRKQLSNQLTELALKQAGQNNNEALIIRGHNWHQGVLGIVAGRVLDATGKPTIVVSNNGDNLVMKGSGRSREGFNLYQALDPLRRLMVSFGGHPQACGLSVKINQVDALQEAFNQAAIQQGFNSRQKAELKIDAAASPELLNDLTTVRLIQQLQPYGPNNAEPELMIKNSSPVGMRTMGDHDQHLRFKVHNLTCVMFNCPFDPMDLIDHQLDIVGHLNLNYWQGRVNVQLLIDDLDLA